jgi:hypothetical protein
MTNRIFAETDQYFQACCKAVEIPATKRQASRWHNKKGLAYKKGQFLVKKKA